MGIYIVSKQWKTFMDKWVIQSGCFPSLPEWRTGRREARRDAEREGGESQRPTAARVRAPTAAEQPPYDEPAANMKYGKHGQSAKAQTQCTQELSSSLIFTKQKPASILNFYIIPKHDTGCKENLQPYKYVRMSHVVYFLFS